MRKPDLSKWHNAQALEGLLLFAQVFEEALFDHTLDTYKVPALNSHFIVKEFLLVSRDIQRGDLKPASLTPVGQELLELTRACPVMRKLLAPDIEWHLHPFQKSEKNMQLARDRARHINGIADARYLNTLQELLMDTVAGGKEKQRITQLTRALICELINRGYSSKHLYYLGLNFFFRDNQVDSTTQLKEFLSEFSLDDLKYTAVIRCSRSFRLTKSFSEIAGISVLDEPPSPQTDDPKEARWLGEGKSDSVRHLRLTDIEAKDPHSALDHAIQRARLLTSFTSFHMHREKLNWENQSLVLGPDGKAHLVKPPTLSVYKRPDVGEDRLSAQVTKFAEVVLKRKLSDESVSTLLRALRLHTDAIHSDQPTTQYIYLWTAIETLAPKDKTVARINAFLKFMVPFLCVAYPVKLLYDISRSLERHERRRYLDVLVPSEPGNSRVEKLAGILVLDSNSEKADELLALCEGNPLLRHRLFRFRKTLKKPADIKRLLVSHERRVSQHLQRMYRVRNMILHAGASMPYLNTLIENLHTYFDLIVNLVVRETEPYEGAEREIEAVSMQVSEKYSSHLQWLQNNKATPLDDCNYRQAIFGNVD